MDGLAKASILDINGVAVPSAAAFLLDTYTGAAAGYSVRRIASSATVLVRVRRETAGGTGDDDEADVAYDSNNILSLNSAISNASAGVTATTLGQFLNVGTVNGTTYTNPDSLTVTASCLVDTWYDQAGSNDAEQTTFTDQLSIHSGAANTDIIKENGKPALDAAQSITTGMSVTLSSALSQPNTYSIVAKHDSGATRSTMSDGGTNRNLIRTNAFDELQINAGSSVNGSDPTGSQHNFFALFNGSNSYCYVDATQDISGDAGTQSLGTTIYLCIDSNSTSVLQGTMQEWIVWNSDQSSNRSDIEENINSDYLIYQPTDAPTSGLLADYTGAAAAYSVRQLSDKAVIAMRIRRDSDDEERNIGFDANGDLDTTAISDFCQTANGYVTRWADQSTNGNHADQATDTSQPQIYNGTAVVTENGKPALDFDGSNDGLNCSTNLRTTTGASTVIQVRKVPSPPTSGVFYQPFVFYKVQRQLMDISAYSNVSISTNETASEYIKFSGMNVANQLLSVSTWDGSTQTGGVDEVIQYKDGAQETGTASTNSMGVSPSGTNSIGFRSDTNSQFCLGTFQEVIVWLSDQDSAGNRTGIETNINDYFSIY